MDRGDCNNRRRHFIFQGGGIHFAQPAELFFTFIDIQLGDKIFVAGEHHHHQQTAYQRHIDQRQQRQNQLRLAHAEDVRQYVENLLKKFDRQRNQPERKTKINRRQQPNNRTVWTFSNIYFDSLARITAANSIAKGSLPRYSIPAYTTTPTIDEIIIVAKSVRSLMRIPQHTANISIAASK